MDASEFPNLCCLTDLYDTNLFSMVPLRSYYGDHEYDLLSTSDPDLALMRLGSLESVEDVGAFTSRRRGREEMGEEGELMGGEEKEEVKRLKAENEDLTRKNAELNTYLKAYASYVYNLDIVPGAMPHRRESGLPDVPMSVFEFDGFRLKDANASQKLDRFYYNGFPILDWKTVYFNKKIWSPWIKMEVFRDFTLSYNDGDRVQSIDLRAGAFYLFEPYSWDDADVVASGTDDQVAMLMRPEFGTLRGLYAISNAQLKSGDFLLTTFSKPPIRFDNPFYDLDVLLAEDGFVPPPTNTTRRRSSIVGLSASDVSVSKFSVNNL